MAKIHILVGTVMGTSLSVAKTAQTVLEGFGHQVHLFETFEASALDPNTVVLACTSSTGMGDLPENIVPLYLHLTQDFPRIAGMKYGVISLGDSSYPNFAQAGHRLDEAFADIGAQRTGEILVLDALSDEAPEKATKIWLEEWQQLI
ncbi:MAG: flavodoxin domain-containing protein [Agarilytica sp.]